MNGPTNVGLPNHPSPNQNGSSGNMEHLHLTDCNQVARRPNVPPRSWTYLSHVSALLVDRTRDQRHRKRDHVREPVKKRRSWTLCE